MKNKIFLDVHKSRIKVAITENDELAEFYVEREASQKLVGNIYKGKVVNVLAGMQAAFVNTGLEKNAYLFVGETMVDKTELVGNIRENINLNLKVGDCIMVQVVKEQFGSKGVRVTTDITLPGRYVVYMPNADYIGVSRKIEDEDKKRELTEVLEKVRPKGAGFVLRTVSENISPELICKEALSLIDLYSKICKEYESIPECTLVHEESDLIMRVVRDIFNEDTESLYVNTQEIYNKVVDRFGGFLLINIDKVVLYNGKRNMFEEFGLTKPIDNILKRKVNLKSGAYLVIDRTEALTVIDVNTGRFVGDNNLENTVFKTNLVAAEEIAKQLRLRNIGGIIIIDFIDMDEIEHRNEVVEKLKLFFRNDRIKTTVIGITGLGLVELTRKKSRSMIDGVMLQPCPYCNGDGFVYSGEYVIMKLREEMHKFFERNDTEVVSINVNPQVFGKLFSMRILEEECASVWLSKRIYIVPDQLMHIEKYKIIDCGSGVIDLPDTAKLLY